MPTRTLRDKYLTARKHIIKYLVRHDEGNKLSSRELIALAKWQEKLIAVNDAISRSPNREGATQAQRDNRTAFGEKAAKAAVENKKLGNKWGGRVPMKMHKLIDLKKDKEEVEALVKSENDKRKTENAEKKERKKQLKKDPRAKSNWQKTLARERIHRVSPFSKGFVADVVGDGVPDPDPVTKKRSKSKKKSRSKSKSS